MRTAIPVCDLLMSFLSFRAQSRSNSNDALLTAGLCQLLARDLTSHTSIAHHQDAMRQSNQFR
jgi:hypothetical protein